MNAPSIVAADDSAAHAPLRFREFVALIAGLMSVNALASSAILAAIPDIGAALGAAGNDRQSVLTWFFVGFSFGQLLIGPLSDRFGRRSVLLWGLGVYGISTVLCAAANDFDTLLAARLLQGLGSAAPRVITISIVRDCYSGRRMAQVMSLAMTVLMVVPVIAPTLGLGILVAVSWQGIFALLLVYGLAMTLWTAMRLPETLPRDRRRAISPRELARSFRALIASRQTFGYTLAGGVAQGSLLATLFSWQQVIGEHLGMAQLFTLSFSTVAAAMSTAAYFNSVFVGQFGMRVLSQAAILGAIALTAILIVLVHTESPGYLVFTAVYCAVNGFFVMVSSNANALAMEPQGHIAGAASSLFGFMTTLMSTIIAHTIGSLYNGGPLPMLYGTLACGSAALLIVVATEKGRLFAKGR